MKVLHCLALLSVIALTACATQVRSTGAYVASAAQSGGTLPRPQRVLVFGFASDWSEVKLDRGIGARLQRGLVGGDLGDQKMVILANVRDSVVTALVDDLTKMGFAAQEASSGTPLVPGDLVVQGQITEIDQGNRTRRLAVGFGAGMSEVRADAQVFSVGLDGSMRLLQTYSGSATSGRKPGFALGAGIAAAKSTVVPLVVSGALGATSETRKTNVAGQAQRLGHRIGYNLGQFFVSQGWIQAANAPSITLL